MSEKESKTRANPNLGKSVASRIEPFADRAGDYLKDMLVQDKSNLSIRHKLLAVDWRRHQLNSFVGR